MMTSRFFAGVVAVTAAAVVSMTPSTANAQQGECSGGLCGTPTQTGGGGGRFSVYSCNAICGTVLMPITHTTQKIISPEFEGDVLQVRDLHFSYPDGHVALRGVSLNLSSGDKAALVGPNGAGKSTLMLHLNGILEGRVCDGGHLSGKGARAMESA